MKPASGPRYGRASRPLRASETGDPLYERAAPDVASPPRKNAVHSVLAALPPLMLMIGLGVFYLGEREQAGGAPIADESRHHVGEYAGVSQVRSGGAGRHYLWFAERGERRNVRIAPEDVERVRAALEPGAPIELDAAPTVAGSSTHWAWRLVSGDRVVLDLGARLR